MYEEKDQVKEKEIIENEKEIIKINKELIRKNSLLDT